MTVQEFLKTTQTDLFMINSYIRKYTKYRAAQEFGNKEIVKVYFDNFYHVLRIITVY